MSDHAATVRENVGHLARGCRSDMYHDPTRYEQAVRAALDALEADLAKALVLDDYEAANLLAGLLALRQVGLDTGDWLGQLLNRLPVVEQAPNVPVYEQVVRAKMKLGVNALEADLAAKTEALTMIAEDDPSPLVGSTPDYEAYWRLRLLARGGLSKAALAEADA